MRRLLAVMVALALTVAACGGAESDETTTSAAETTVPTTVPTTVATTTVPVGAVAEDLDGLVAAAEEIRGLSFLDQPTITVLTDEELEARIRAELEEEIDPADIAIEEALFELLGLIDPDLDLLTAYTNLYAEQVAAFYDADTRELVVPGSSDATPLTKTIVVHELIHALTDQHFGFGATLDALVDEERFHEASALQALVEGDATYFQIVYLQSLPIAEQLDAARESLAADMTVLEALPEFIGADLAFAYDAGFRFVERLVADLGIVGVDQALRRPPTTTEQILRPDAYLGLEPGVEVELGDIAPSGWETAIAGTLGEWNISNYLLRGVDRGTATIAAAGWGGDAYAVLTSDAGTALVMKFVGDTPRDTAELSNALVESLPATADVRRPVTSVPTGDEAATVPFTARFSGGVFASLQHLGRDLVLVVATDEATVSAIAEVLSLG
ncbi:MAG TPA: hypothetical protein VLD62_11800 [Acidimicrobiia bacterium]|nr:hypothetical protein [Acidimicrobiia bacterium]